MTPCDHVHSKVDEPKVEIVSKDRSVQDYKSRKELVSALKAMHFNQRSRDWELTNYDVSAIRHDPNNVEDEVDRLLVLQSYNILDSAEEIEFEMITREAKLQFQVRTTLRKTCPAVPNHCTI